MGINQTMNTGKWVIEKTIRGTFFIIEIFELLIILLDYSKKVDCINGVRKAYYLI